MTYKDVSREITELASNYQYQKPPEVVVKIQDLLRQIAQWLWEWLDALNVKKTGPADSKSLSTLLQLGLWAAGIVAVLVLIIYFWSRARAAVKRSAEATGGAAKIERILDSSGLKAKAREEAEAGQFKGACRSLYLSLLQLLAENEIAPFSPAKTNYEYQYLLNRHKHLKPPFKDVTDVVEEVWFGTRPCGQDDYRKVLSDLELLEGLVKNLPDGAAEAAK